MKLEQSISHQALTITFTSPTVVEPGSHFAAAITLHPHQHLVLDDLSWDTPEVLLKSVSEQVNSWPVQVEPDTGYAFEVEFFSEEDREGYGVIEHLLSLKTESGEEIHITFDHWISVFSPAEPSITRPLSDQYRARLINVVNARPQHGHIFLANYVSFFQDYLHLHIPESFTAQLSEEFGFPMEGLPVDQETYLEIARGNIQFYGIEELTLLAEEDCEESDDRFDTAAINEV